MSEKVITSVAEGNCVAVRRGGEQPEAKDWSALRYLRRTNPIRRGVVASLRLRGEAWNSLDTLKMTGKAMSRRITWLGTERSEGCVSEAGRPVAGVTAAGVRAFIVPTGHMRWPEKLG